MFLLNPMLSLLSIQVPNLDAGELQQEYIQVGEKFDSGKAREHANVLIASMRGLRSTQAAFGIFFHVGGNNACILEALLLKCLCQIQAEAKKVEILCQNLQLEKLKSVSLERELAELRVRSQIRLHERRVTVSSVRKVHVRIRKTKESSPKYTPVKKCSQCDAFNFIARKRCECGHFFSS